MFNTFDLYTLPWLAIVISTIAYFLIGWLWYSPVLFAKPWMALLGITPDNIDKSEMGKIMGINLLLTFAICFANAVLIRLIGIATVGAAIKLGLLVSLFYVFTTHWVNYLYERKPFKLLAINAGYNIAGICVACNIIVLMG